MKKIFLFAAVLSAFTFASCKKDRTCTCTSTTTSGGSSTTGTAQVVKHKKIKKNTKNLDSKNGFFNSSHILKIRQKSSLNPILMINSSIDSPNHRIYHTNKNIEKKIFFSLASIPYKGGDDCS